MKKSALFVLIFFVSGILHAQIKLTKETSVPKIGDSYTYVSVKEKTVNLPGVPAEGEKCVWDLSSLDLSDKYEYTIKYVAQAEASMADKYATSTMVEINDLSMSETMESYISISENSMLLDGLNIILPMMNICTVFSEKQLMLRFPMSYRDEFKQAYSSTTIMHDKDGGIPAYDDPDRNIISEGGIISIKADAYGKLILPDVTYDNVLRIKAMAESTTNSEEREAIMYSWYSLNKRKPVAFCIQESEGEEDYYFIRYLED